MKKSPFKKVAKGIKKIPNINRKDHKYVLLDNEEDGQLMHIFIHSFIITNNF